MTWSFKKDSRERVADAGLAERLHAAAATSKHKMDALVGEMPNWHELRQRARQIKLHTLSHLDKYLRLFVEAAEAAGAVVSWADTGKEACRQVVALARRHGVTRATKAKSMTGEEIGINRALEAAGIEPVETDLGEMICQLSGEMPSHVTAPVIHKSAEDIARLMLAKGIIDEIPAALRIDPETVAPASRRCLHRWDDCSDESEDAAGAERTPRASSGALGQRSSEALGRRIAAAAELTAAARRALREKFMTAEMGISGANFLVARTGTVVLIENEANIRLSTTLPDLHVAVVGIDKLIPDLADLGTFLSLLPVAATGQRQTAYVSLICGTGVSPVSAPPGRRCHNKSLHIILLDNGRTRLLADRQQYDLLSCIRCGACLTVCPVYRHVSGHGYNAIYSGPIGAVLMPHLRPEEEYRQLPFASSLCGACTEICPVGIPLAERLLQWRERIVSEGGRPKSEAAAFGLWAWLMQHPTVYRAARPPADWADAATGLVGPGRSWKATRDMPPLATETFTDWWKKKHARRRD